MSFADWLPDEEFKFSVDRDPHIMSGEYRIEPSSYVADFVRRTWRERLFEIPWRPWVRLKPCEVAYIVDKTVLVSWKTFKKIKGDSK